MTALYRQSRSSGHDVEQGCLGDEIEEKSGVDVIDVRVREGVVETMRMDVENEKCVDCGCWVGVSQLSTAASYQVGSKSGQYVPPESRGCG
jgi:hypothetical protein